MNWSEKAFQQGVIGLKKSLDKAVEISFTERGYEKVKKIQITQEQEDALKHQVKKHGKDVVFKTHNIHPTGWLDGAEPLNKLDVITMAKVLYASDSYEVIPQYNVRDWVFLLVGADSGAVKEITLITESSAVNRNICFELDGEGIFYENEVRHATPEEIQKEIECRWWNNHGREVWEIREGDILKNETHYPYFVTRGNRTEQGLERTPSLNCIFMEIDEIKSRFKVACFVEQRLDK